MQRIAIFPGSFDPITNGHLDIIKRASGLFDKIIVGVLKNFDKNYCFSIEKRIGYISKVIKDIKNAEVKSFDGLLVDFAESEGAGFLIKGVRTSADFEYEYKMAAINNHLAPGIETVVLIAYKDTYYISSGLVKQVAELGGDISGMVPVEISQDIIEHFFNGGRL